MKEDLLKRVDEIQAISAVPTILETVAALTALRFVCIAHVTDDSWTACAVHDKLGFGLEPGAQLDVTTTLCEEVRDTASAVRAATVSRIVGTALIAWISSTRFSTSSCIASLAICYLLSKHASTEWQRGPFHTIQAPSAYTRSSPR